MGDSTISLHNLRQYVVICTGKKFCLELPVCSFQHCPLIQATLAKFACEDVVRGIIESLDGVKVDNNHCSYLIHPGSYFIIEDIQAGQA